MKKNNRTFYSILLAASIILLVYVNFPEKNHEVASTKSINPFASYEYYEEGEEYERSAQEYQDLLGKMRGTYSHEQYLRVRAEIDQMPSNREALSWYEKGPDNIGGRSRAVLVDRNNINRVWAGSVSGGLFESTNRANTWNQMMEFSENLSVSSMAQTIDGTLYVATGHRQETSTGSQNSFDTGANGFGIYWLAGDGSFEHIDGTQDHLWINEIVADTIHNHLWFASNQGLFKYYPATEEIIEVDAGLTAGGCSSLEISKDGEVIVCAMSGGRTNVSVDGGMSFTNVSSSAGSANPIDQGAGRIEYAISHERASNGNYYVYASTANSSLLGIWWSEDNGLNWGEIAPENDGAPGSFAPFTAGGGTNGQGFWNNVISVQKGNPSRIFLGGIDMYSWATTGNWTQLSQWFLHPTDPKYVHADNHDIFWDNQGRVYIANDGGISFSDDYGLTFKTANRGFNTAQFYAIGASAHGDVIGGTQDNGTIVNYHDNATYHEFKEVVGGDGFSAELSFINEDLAFSSIYYGAVFRSMDRGINSEPFIPLEFAPTGTNSIGCTPGSFSGGGCGQFFTNFKLWENPNDLNSTDSITFIPSQGYEAGEVIQIPSATTATEIDYTLTEDVIFDDTAFFDPSIIEFDTLVVSVAPSTEFNLAVFDYSFVSGGHPIESGDSIYIADLDTTIEVLSSELIQHYYATSPLSPGDTLDLIYETYELEVVWDTLKIQDPYQSWFAIGLGGGDGIWMTRNALRFSAPTEDWFRVNHESIDEVATMEFSRDGQHLYIGTWTGQLYRLSGFGEVYSPRRGEDTLIDVNNVSDIANISTTWTAIHPGSGFGAPVTGIGVEGNVDHVVVTLGNYTGSNKVRETNDATAMAPSWNSISGNLPNSPFGGSLPVYSIVIDRNDPNTMVIGTDQGTFISTDGGTIWEYCSAEFGKTPIFDMRQNWRTWDEGCFRPGEIYIGTHGRGIWASEEFLSTPEWEDIPLMTEKEEASLSIFPNPTRDICNLQFKIPENQEANMLIYNLQGTLLYEFSNIGQYGGELMTIDVSDYPSGTYLVVLQSENIYEAQKFIKQ